MDEQASEEQVQSALRLLESQKDYERRAGAERLRYVKWDTPDSAVVQKLKELAESDPSEDVRNAAAATLRYWEKPPVEAEPEHVTSTPPPPPVPTAVKRRHLLIGFFGWYLVNGLLWFALTGASFDAAQAPAQALCLLFAVNFLLPVVLGLSKAARWMALGILAALALNFLVSLLVGTIINGICFVPFFFNTGHVFG